MTAVEDKKINQPKKNAPLELNYFLQGLLSTGRINKADYNHAVENRRSANEINKHVLQYVADLNLQDRKAATGRTLDIESLTMSLSVLSGQDYLRIDPLKIDVAQITKVMSYAFTQRHHILAVEVTPFHVTIASAEPFVNS